ncbi:MAG: GntR family transcriptional regulator [Deltaproteobacteria bacterium]|nr:GntR family transcriptional regulator [Deltaproteobacteria bacterium]
MLKETIYQEILKKIISGQYLPGERLTETRLSEEFQCSRGPVREALNRLETEGFLEHVPYHGATIKKHSPKDIKEYFELKELLEGKAVEWATPGFSEEDIAYLAGINRSMKHMSPNEEGYVEKWQSANRAFHQFIRQRCGNEKMNWLVDEILLRVIKYHKFLITRNRDGFLQDHDTIVEAIKRRDARKARLAMEQHISRAKELIIEFISDAWGL